MRSGIHDEVLGAGVQASTPSKQQGERPARVATSSFATPPLPPDTNARKQLKRHPIIPRSSSSAWLPRALDSAPRRCRVPWIPPRTGVGDGSAAGQGARA